MDRIKNGFIDFKNPKRVYLLIGLSCLAICMYKIHHFTVSGNLDILIIICATMLMSLLLAALFFKQIERSELKYHTIFDLSPEPLWIYDRDTLRFCDVNAAAIFHYGYSKEEFLKMSILDIRPPEQKDKVRKYLQGERDVINCSRIQTVHRQKSGQDIMVEVISRNIDLPFRRLRLILASDVTDRLRALEEMERLKSAALAANEAKSQFLAHMSHEIRTPLGAVLGFAEIMKNRNCTEEEQDEFLERITRSGETLSRIINDILDLSKVESQKMEIEKISFSVGEVVESVLSLLKLKASEKSIVLSTNLETHSSLRIVSDPTRLRQILINLVGNAIKFTEFGEVRIEVQDLDSGASIKENHRIQFKVIDSGHGITEDQRYRLFGAFMQGDSSTTRHFGGTGLGLILSRKLAQAMGGEVKLLCTEEGKGSTFEALIAAPIDPTATTWSLSSNSANALAKPLIAKAQNSNKPDPFKPLRGMHVLLVDDAPDNCRLISKILQSVGAEVNCVSDGEAGVEAAMAGGHDIVLMDIQMPRLDGFGALERLRKLDYRQPVIALTAHAMTSDKIACANAGFADHIEKPIRSQLLIDTISRLSRPFAGL